MAEAVAPLRRGLAMEPSVRQFLDKRFRDAEDLREIAAVQAELQGRCSELEAAVVDLDGRLRRQLEAYSSRAATVDKLLGKVRDGLLRLGSYTAGSSPDGGRSGEIEDESSRGDKITADKLLALAKEVARVETVRTYAETALKLDRLIGEVEDVVSSCMTGKIRQPLSESSEGLRLTAVDHLTKTEEILANITRSQPRWRRLIAATDDRVDRALAVLRPQAIADHRSLLVSLGWPPPLSASKLTRNPLMAMDADVKRGYGESFLSLCRLQDFQSRRRCRHLGGAARRAPLWAIEELAGPVALASQKHFPRWTQKPEFIFALVYKTLGDLVNAMDEVLQPLVDRARLAGYSCREEWVAAMVSSLATYLAKEVFPAYVAELERESGTGGGGGAGARGSWLHLVDQMMLFDRRASSLVSGGGLLVEEEELQRVSSLSVFCDRPDWLDLWAEVELADALDKLKPELDDPGSWRRSASQRSPELEEFKSPLAAGAAVRRLSALIDRCRHLPSLHLRARFVRLAAAPLLREFIDAAACRCQEAEGLTALVDDEALAKVCASVNGARHCEAAVSEWWEDMFFLEMADSSGDGEGRGLLQREVEALRRLRAEWLDKMSAAIMRGFEAACREHIRNKKQWQEEEEATGQGGITFSSLFVGALDYLQGRLRRMEEELNAEDFVALWRGLALTVDRLLLGSVLLGGARFSGGGAARFAGDLAALLGVFAAWCLRPEGFFPRAAEGLRLIKMEDGEVEEGLRRGLPEWLASNGMRHLTVAEAEKMIRTRVR